MITENDIRNFEIFIEESEAYIENQINIDKQRVEAKIKDILQSMGYPVVIVDCTDDDLTYVIGNKALYYMQYINAGERTLIKRELRLIEDLDEIISFFRSREESYAKEIMEALIWHNGHTYCS